MPDIAMCRNEKCPRKETCYRYMATPCEPGQCYGEFDHKDCEYYWPIEDNPKAMAKAA